MQTLTLRCTLKPTPEQAAALEATVGRFAEGCNHALRVAKERGEFRRFKLHRLVYRDLRAMGLSANLAVQAIARVGRKKGSRAKFYQPTSCAFDVRTLSLWKEDEAVSLTTVAGRQVIPMRLGNYQRGLLARAKSIQGGVLTKGPRGKWYIHLSLRVETPEPPNGGGKVVGLDLGQKALATLSSEGVAVGDTGLYGQSPALWAKYIAGNLADWVAAYNIALRGRGCNPVPQGIVAQRAGSMGMGRKGSGMAAGRFAPNLCKPAPILRVSSLHCSSLESSRL